MELEKARASRITLVIALFAAVLMLGMPNVPVATNGLVPVENASADAGARTIRIGITALAYTKSVDSPLGKVRFLGTNLAHPGSGQTAELKAMEDLVFTDAFFPGNPDPGVQSFIIAYRQRFGEAPDYLAAQGYMVVRLLSELVAKEGTVPRTELPLRLLAWKTLPGLPWFMGFTPERLMELRLYLLTIKDGQVRPATAAR